jgi:FAD/FMN-containing dehydrogenase/Fe-S oxidoreductase
MTAGTAPARHRALVADLAARVRGGVRFDAGERALYSTDASNYRHIPFGVVCPLDTADLIETIAVCREHDAPVTMRGGGTSLAGQATNAAVIVDVSRHLTGILALDPDRRTARVQPGVVLDNLRAAAERHGLTFAPDPATHDRCTLGGMLGNDSCGVHSIMAGRTSENVSSLEVLTYDGLRLTVGRTSDEDLERLCADEGRRGEIYRGLRDIRDRCGDLVRERFPRLPRLVSGFALGALLPENGFDVARALVGTEGTCVTILGAELRLVPSPPARAMLLIGFDDVFAAADAAPEVMTTRPIGLEGLDDRLVEGCRAMGLNLGAIPDLPPGGGWLIVEYGGATAAEAEAMARDAENRLNVPATSRVIVDRGRQRALWSLRESSVGATARIPGKKPTYPGFEDSAVPPGRLGAYLRDLDTLLRRFGYDRTLYGHFGDGCVHLRTEFEFRTVEGRAEFRSFMEQAADLVVRHGGSLSGEHGDGQARAELLDRQYGHELVGAFREFKAIWDPRNRMNPGMVIDPLPLDTDLRWAFPLADPKLIFDLPADGGSLAHAADRCVGVGKCRRESGGAMCPTYQATHEERHSTRGRARLLWEMLEGSEITALWRSREVLEGLDLCIACKSCKGDCPVKVDIATYKAEFMAHHYAGRLRPRAAYSMGLIHWWAHLASIAPGLANSVGTLPGVSALAKLVAGVDSHRDLPRFADRTFRRSIEAATPDLGGARDAERRAVLFADTFTEGFAPTQGLAALRVLRAAGFTVEVPRADLCCGRPLYDRGFLRQARRLLGRMLDTFEPELDSGVPVVVLEPSCEAVFHDELPNLFSRDPRARRLDSMVMGLGAFVARNESAFGPLLARDGWREPAVAAGSSAVDDANPLSPAPAILHGHCHMKATVGMAAEESVLRSIGIEPSQPEPGCCGMAGAFGFERGEHYELSMKIGERNLLPAVRAAALDQLVIADGFSCREQIAGATGRRPLHLAEVLAMTLPDGWPGNRNGGPREPPFLDLDVGRNAAPRLFGQPADPAGDGAAEGAVEEPAAAAVQTASVALS